MQDPPLRIEFCSNFTELPYTTHDDVIKFSALLAFCVGNSPVTGEFPAQKPVTRNFDVFCDLRLNKRLSKQWWCLWFGHHAHCDVIIMTMGNGLMLFSVIMCRYDIDQCPNFHYDDVTMSGMASQITSLRIVYSTVYPGADQRKHQSPASLAFVRGIHRGPVNSPHKWPVTRKVFPFDDVIMLQRWFSLITV